MAKGGGRANRQARKQPEVFPPAGSGSNTPILEVGESSKAEGMNGTVHSLPEIIEMEFHQSDQKQKEEMLKEIEKDVVECEIQGKLDPPLRSRGMALGYVAPVIKEGKLTAKLNIDEIGKESKKWKSAVIFYVIGEAPTITYLRAYLKNQCGTIGESEVFYHSEGYFIIRFALAADKEMMLYGGPYMMVSKPVIVKDWCTEFCFEKEVLREVPLWVRLPKLPLPYWGGDSVSRIGSVIGKPLCADECTTMQKRISYARLLVEVDITKPLLYKVQIEGEEGKMIDQQVFYEWVPMFCQTCHKVGHICKKMEDKAPVRKQLRRVKDKGKEIVEEVAGKKEEWVQPKKVASPSIQVGIIEVPTSSNYIVLDIGNDGNADKGGDHFPLLAP